MYSRMIEALETAGKHASVMLHAEHAAPEDAALQALRAAPEEIEMAKEVIDFLNKYGFEEGAE